MRFLFFLFPLLISYSFGQKKTIDHRAYKEWNMIQNAQISSTGNYISYEINPHKGDGKIYLYNTKTEHSSLFSRGKEGKFTRDENVFVFKIIPEFDTIRQLKIKKIKKNKWVKDSIAIFWIKEDRLIKFSNLISFQVAEDGNTFAYTLDKDSLNVQNEKEKKKSTKKKKKEEIKLSSSGNTLFIRSTDNKSFNTLENVKKYGLNKTGTHLYFVTHQKEKKEDFYQLYLYNLEANKITAFDGKYRDIPALSFSEKGNQFSFLTSVDTSKVTRKYQLYSWDILDETPLLIVDTNSTSLPEGLTISPNKKPYYSENEQRLFFGLQPLPKEEPKDTIPDDEKAELDLWHYQDKRLQPMQLIELNKDQKKSFLSVYNFKQKEFVQLESDTLFVRLLDNGNTPVAFASSDERYRGSYNWEFPWKSDVYAIQLENGKLDLLKEGIPYSRGISPKGTRMLYYQPQLEEYFAIELENHREICLTCDHDSILWKEDINGMIYDAEPIGSPGYLDENTLLLYSEFDIWKYDFKEQKLENLTASFSPEKERKFRIINLQKDSAYLSFNNLYINELNLENMNEAIYLYEEEKKELNLCLESDHIIYGFQKAKIADYILYRMMNTKDYPEISFADQKLQSHQIISSTNPQQEEYIWPTVELIEWKSYQGKKIKGLIYKPEDFDSTKSYPLMVYYYEKYSDRKNQHYIPRPSASTINPAEYASAGYVVFYPDIHYEAGHPGNSAYDCIMSGTDKVLELYPNIDSTRMGLQGQSWGGYQTAQMVTLTNRYAAAMAGAPVSNMFSAYGGIRWGSGFNRAFQYEHTQSRIGGTIWENPELYFENSPLFGVPNINTPLLIMHNDEDGAVPWYQGIELFTAMKRLGKKVWLLQYNKEKHNLTKDANKVDLSIRMRQFFDHYLLHQPAPKWLIEGIPALDKNKDYKYELEGE